MEISEKRAVELREELFRMWPEMTLYFKFINNCIGCDKGTIAHMVSKRVRGGVTFTQACNTFFSGLSADACKLALFEVSKRSYINTNSSLYGSRPVMYIHDEIIMESPIDKAPQAADELALVMREKMRLYTPDIPIKTTVAIMDRWYKDAEEVRDKDGNLLVWGQNDLGRGGFS